MKDWYDDVKIKPSDTNNIVHPDYPGLSIRVKGEHTAKEIHFFLAEMLAHILPGGLR